MNSIPETRTKFDIYYFIDDDYLPNLKNNRLHHTYALLFVFYNHLSI
jgi:hypothetical protein